MGTYTNKTITPLQRPDDFAGRELLTEEEIVALEHERVEQSERLLHAPAEKTVVGGLPRLGCAVGFYKQFLAGLAHRVHGTHIAYRRPTRRTHSARDARIRTVRHCAR